MHPPDLLPPSHLPTSGYDPSPPAAPFCHVGVLQYILQGVHDVCYVTRTQRWEDHEVSRRESRLSNLAARRSSAAAIYSSSRNRCIRSQTRTVRSRLEWTHNDRPGDAAWSTGEGESLRRHRQGPRPRVHHRLRHGVSGQCLYHRKQLAALHELLTAYRLACCACLNL